MKSHIQKACMIFLCFILLSACQGNANETILEGNGDKMKETIQQENKNMSDGAKEENAISPSNVDAGATESERKGEYQKVATPASPQEMRELSSMELVADMGIGINLGNTLEAFGDWIKGTSVKDYETAWGSPVITREIIEGIARSGFKTVRVPVAWSNLMEADYTIHEGLMNRVEEVVGYILENNMYAIINIHYDGGWFAKFSTDYDEAMKKYRSIWKQVSERFKNYSDYLIFESLNEEGCWDDIWNRWSGNNESKPKAYGILNNINQEFVNIVRASGSNNTKRHLLIAGYATDIDLTCDPEFKMPEDPAGRLIVSVHYYTPPTFCILSEDADWGKAAATWGTEEEVLQLKTNFEKMKRNFVDKGIPVIVGEYGATTKNKERASVVKFLTMVCQTAYEMNMCPILWDTPGGFYNRYTCSFDDKELLESFQRIASSR
mgnify:CR=1 FL=1